MPSKMSRKVEQSRRLQQRAESMIPKCDVGFLRRPERVVLFIIGALSTRPSSHNFFANRMPAVLWVLVIGSYWTFAHRMYHTWREVNKSETAEEVRAEVAAAQAVAAERRPEPAGRPRRVDTRHERRHSWRT